MNGLSTKATINVTPLIDILLVLLIVFMTMAPVISHGLNASLPRPANEAAPPQPALFVVTVLNADQVTFNDTRVLIPDLAAHLRTAFRGSANSVVFVRAGGDLEFRNVARVLDIARGAGASRVALLPN